MGLLRIILTIAGRVFEIGGFFLVVCNVELGISSRWGMGVFLFGFLLIGIRNIAREVEEEP